MLFEKISIDSLVAKGTSIKNSSPPHLPKISVCLIEFFKSVENSFSTTSPI
jgi:hypothetical protein